VAYELLVMGASWGGLRAVGSVLEGLGSVPGTAVVVVQHRGAASGELLAPLLQRRTDLIVREAEDKDPLEPGVVYLAPPDYHTLIEADGRLALSTDDLVRHARPSIDVLFNSAAEAYRERCVGVVLTGSNDDGAAGLARIVELGGVAVVQDPRTAERREMPAAAVAASHVDVVLPLEEIGPVLRGLLLQPAAGGAEKPEAGLEPAHFRLQGERSTS
jgi:two-component system, chemotaxis family, protein-glutamate methylesterase/glutaminase